MDPSNTRPDHPVRTRRQQVSSSIHKTLAWRLGLTAVAISLALGALSFVGERDRIELEAAELAFRGTHRFNLQYLELFERPDGIPAGELQKAFARYSKHSSRDFLSDGHFVIARIHDMEGILLAELRDEQYARLDNAAKVIDESDVDLVDDAEYRVVTDELAGNTYVKVVVSLSDGEDRQVATMAGVFAVSEEAMLRIRRDVLITALYVIGIILITTVLIYPIISRLVSRLVMTSGNLLEANLQTLQVLGSAIAKRDGDTDAHNYRVTLYAARLAEERGMNGREVQGVIKGALMHDVGKIGIRDDVLLKPGVLDPEEFEIMKTHVSHGMEITSRANWLRDAGDIVGAHHERFDGSGYPNRLRGAEIPLKARIFAIVDVFDALTSRRPYKEPLGFDQAREILEKGRGAHFDPDLLDTFLAIADEVFAKYSTLKGEALRSELDDLTTRYFRRDVGSLLALD